MRGEEQAVNKHCQLYELDQKLSPALSNEKSLLAIGLQAH